jgi:hypothetical protein
LRSNGLRNAAIFLTILIGFWHLFYMFHAGGLWRDEAQTLAIAGMSTIADIWNHLGYGSFPMLWFLILRAYESILPAGDLVFRLLGCVIGLSLVAVLWLNARLLKFNFPLVSLALLGFSPMVVKWGDSMRAYGFGSVLIVLTFMMIWQVVNSPTKRNVALAAIVAICSVQALYHNTVLLLAIGMAGVAVALLNRQWKRAAIVIGIGIVAAVSLLPYAPPMQRRSEFSIIFLRSEFNSSWFWSRISDAVNYAGTGLNWVWLGLVLGAVFFGMLAWLRTDGHEETERRNSALYCLVVLLVSVPSCFVLFKIMRYPSQTWNYLPLLAVAAVAVDGLWSRLDRRWPLVEGRVVIALGVAAWSFLPMWDAVHTRQTNVDLVAARLHELVDPGDMILVSRWYYGISFNRYYSGVAPWKSLPPISDYRVHRYDLVKEQMASTDPIRPVIDSLTKTLKSGNRVYVVGNLIFSSKEEVPRVYEPAPHDVIGWDQNGYLNSWKIQTGAYLKAHVQSGERVTLPDYSPVNPSEDHSLWVLHGWQD